MRASMLAPLAAAVVLAATSPATAGIIAPPPTPVPGPGSLSRLGVGAAAVAIGARWIRRR